MRLLLVATEEPGSESETDEPFNRQAKQIDERPSEWSRVIQALVASHAAVY